MKIAHFGKRIFSDWKYPPEFILIFSSSLWRFSEALVDFSLDLISFEKIVKIVYRSNFDFISSAKCGRWGLIDSKKFFQFVLSFLQSLLRLHTSC